MMINDRRFSIFLELGHDWNYPNTRFICQEAESLGFDTVWYQDNLTGHHPIPRDIEKFDVWALLPAIAADTNTIRLGPLVTPAIRREAPLLAYAAASLDQISNGRLNLGLGSGDDKEQYEMIGQPFPETGKERRRILAETIEVMKVMWTEERANFAGDYFRLNNAILSPKPVQTPYPPLYIGCSNSRRMMPRLAAEHADCLAVMWDYDQHVAETINAFKEEWRSFDRDPKAFEALRSGVLIFCEHEDIGRARQYTEELTGLPANWEVTASPAEVPEGSAPNMFIIGQPETIAAEIQRRVFGMGFTQLMCSFVVCDDIDVSRDELPGHPGNYLAGMRLFVDEVVPRLV